MAGFTLMEMLIAMAILAILLAMAAPSMKSFLSSGRTAADAQSLYDALRFAKSQAQILNHDVIVCPQNDATGSCGSGTDWTGLGLKVVDAATTAAPYRVWNKAKGSASGTLAGYSQVVASPDGALLFKNGSAYYGGSQYLIYCDPNAASGSSGVSLTANSAGLVAMAIANLAASGAYQKCS